MVFSSFYTFKLFCLILNLPLDVGCEWTKSETGLKIYLYTVYDSQNLKTFTCTIIFKNSIQKHNFKRILDFSSVIYLHAPSSRGRNVTEAVICRMTALISLLISLADFSRGLLQGRAKVWHEHTSLICDFWKKNAIDCHYFLNVDNQAVTKIC